MARKCWICRAFFNGRSSLHRKGHHGPRGPRAGSSATRHVHRLDRFERPPPPRLRGGRQRGGRGARRPQRPRRRDDPSGQFRDGPRRGRRHSGRRHRRPGAACADGRAHEAARRREVRRRRLQGVGRPARRRRLRRQRALRMACRGGTPRRKGVPPGVRARGAHHEGGNDRRRAQGRIGHDDLVPSRLGGLRGDRVRRRDAYQRLRETAFLTRGLRIILRDERAGGKTRGVPLRRRDPRLRRVCQRVEGHRPQARRLRRGRERRRPRRDRDAVEQLVRRVGLLVREQHQHDRGRRPPLGVQGRAHRDAQPLRQGQGSLEGEGGQPRGRGRPRGARSGHLRQASKPAVRRSDEDEARQPRRGRPRQDHREPEARRVPRGEPNGCAADHYEGGLGVPSPASGAQGTRADAAEERPRVQLAPGPPRRLSDQRSRGSGALSRGGPLGRRLSGRRARPDVPGDPSAARQGDQRREEPNKQGSFQRGDPGDHHSDRHGHCRGVRRREAPLPPRDRHDGRRRGRRTHPDARS